MERDTFKATAQYDDWKGNVAADNSDFRNFSDFLRDKGNLPEGQIVKGISFYSAEHFLKIDALITDEEYGLSQIPVELTIEEFFKCFKRFALKISRHGELDGQELEYHNTPR